MKNAETAGSLDTGVREFASVSHRIRVKPRDTWITVEGRGGSLMIAAEEVPGVLRLITQAIDYAEGRQVRPERRPRMTDLLYSRAGPEELRDPDFPAPGTTRYELHKDLDGGRCCIKRVEVVGIFESRADARQWMLDHKDE